MSKNILVVLNYNDFSTCKRLLEKIKNYESFYKIVVVDNSSTDASYTELRQAYDSEHIDVIRTNSNKGYATGNNFGCFYAVKKYKPDILFIANPDVLFEEEVIKCLADVLLSHEEYAIAAPLVEHGYNIWRQPGYWGVIESLFLIIFNIDKAFYRRKAFKDARIKEVGVVEGSFFAIKASVFEKVKGFDTRTFLYYEENILGFRLKRNGYKSVIVPNIFYEHLHSHSIKKAFGSKSKAFLKFYTGMLLYLNEYLKVGIFKQLLFKVAFFFAYIERIIYDVVKQIF